MKKLPTYSTAVWACAAVLALAGAAGAQSRKEASFSRVGGGSGKVGYGPSSGFAYQAYGLGNLSGPSPGGQGPLRSSAGGQGLFSLNRQGGAAPGQAGLPSLPLAAEGTVRYEKPGLVLPTRGGPGLASALTGKTANSIGAASIYATLVGTAGQEVLENQDQPVTSLVPAEKSKYQEYMAKGEKALREGDFLEAHNEFRKANLIGVRDPESLLSLAHVEMANAMYSYGAPAFHLRLALKSLPELPLVPLRPKALFGDTPAAAARYLDVVLHLEDHLRRSPNDADALLLMAYLQWFGDETEAAKETLSLALGSSQRSGDEDALEVISIFWDGMVQSGKVSGTLTPTSQPAEPTEAAGSTAR